MNRPVAIACVLAIVASGCAKKEPPPAPATKYTIEQLYKNTWITGGSFSPDGSRLIVTSNESGIMNVHEITIASGDERPVTASTVESFFAEDYVPSTGEIIYSADKGGNEVDHLYLLAKDGTTRDLTPGPKEKAAFTGWSRDRTALYYVSNKRDPRFFDWYRMDTRTWKPVMVYRNDQGFTVGGVSWDEKTVAVSRPVSTSRNRLYLHDLRRKTMTEVSQDSAPGSYDAAGFSRDDRSFFYITDAGREFAYLVRYDMATGERSTVYETDWDVMYAEHSENEKYRVVGVNADGRNVLKVFDVASGLEVPFPPIGDGDVQSVAFSPDETQMRLSIGSSKAPTNVYVYSFVTKELKKLTQALNPELDPADLVAAEVVRFASFDSLKIPAIYYRPIGAGPQNRVPALVWVHGGPGGQSRVRYDSFIQYLVNHGYAVLAVNNRGSGGYGKTFFTMDDRNHGDKDLKDCIWGKKYLQSLPEIDGGRIGIIGGSYGGYITMAAMTFHPEEFQAGVDLFGVTNWLRTLTSMPAYWEAQRKALYAEMGDPYSADSVRLYDISPLFHAAQIRNPVMVLQGANDPRVLKVESDEIVAAVKANNVPVEYVVFDDEGHGFVKKENEIRGDRAIKEFLDKHLKGEVKKGG